MQQYLLREIQNVYRSQRVEINDKHIEIIVAQMLRKVKIETPGDTDLLPGAVIDKFEFRSANEALAKCVKITDTGRQRVRRRRRSCPRTRSSRPTRTIEAARRRRRPRARSRSRRPPARSSWASPRRRCSPSSFISAASFQETTKVLTEAALAGKVDYLVGLKENVILGHLIPAGTGFKHVPGVGSPHPARGPRSPGGREGARCWSVRSRCSNRRCERRQRRRRRQADGNAPQPQAGGPTALDALLGGGDGGERRRRADEHDESRDDAEPPVADRRLIARDCGVRSAVDSAPPFR